MIQALRTDFCMAENFPILKKLVGLIIYHAETRYALHGIDWDRHASQARALVTYGATEAELDRHRYTSLPTPPLHRSI